LTYERLLEELLYSNELLGIPKPKESVSGLVKARTILNQCYGSIFINFSRPISVREMLYRLTSVNNLRPSMSLTPSFVFELTADQNKSIESLSFLVLIEMQRQQIIQPISLIATVLLHSVQYSIDLTSLIKQCQSLKRLLNNLGVKVYWPLGEHSSLNRTHENQLDEMTNIKSLVLYNIESHLNLFDLFNKTNGSFNLIENIKLASEEPFVNCSQFVLSIQKPHKAIKSQTDLLENASIYLAVCSYRNQLVNFLVRISFVCNCLLATAAAASSTSGDRLMFQLGKSSNQITYEMYAFLSLVYNREFIFREGDEKKDFTDAISFLLHTNLIRLSEDGVSYELVSFNLKSFLFLAGLFEPVLNNYLAIYSVLFTVTSQTVQFEDEKKLTKTIQQRLFDKVMSLKEGETLRFDYEALSFNLISNAMLTLRQFDVLKRYDTSNNKLNYEIDLLLLKDRIADKLSYMIETNRMGLNELIDFDLNQTLNEVHSRETCSSVSKLMRPKL
jgi:glycerone phosphate O-acyltransferase